jgi:hypothetical protein
MSKGKSGGRSPRQVLSRIVEVTHIWATMRPTKSFSGLTLEQFREAIKPSHDIRAEITELEGRLQAAVKRRQAADKVSIAVVKRVINGVRSDPEEGEDGEVYSAMGYVRESVRGRNRKRGNGEMKVSPESS